MTWLYDQDTGHMLRDDRVIATGYSGAGDGKNNPEMEDVPNVGPIPLGKYLICGPRDTPTHGPYVLSLVPDAENEMHGRSAFLIHGDSVSKPGSASQGCIILPRHAREAIWESGDTNLEVI